MGTNFYTTKGTHIGKRSAAGLYCFNCYTTLCKGGEKAIHSGRSDWYKVCPQCGKAPINESLDSSTTGLELGFASPRMANERIEVRTCSSFSWAIRPARIRKLHKVKDEYGCVYTIDQFINEVLCNCPIQFFLDSIGYEFS